VIVSKLDFRKKIAAGLCLLMVLFMTAEARHQHQAAQTSCAWCSIAHVPATPGPVTPYAFLNSTGETVALLVHPEKSMLLIPFQLIRPPPTPYDSRT
jgi:hypothetical protein